MRIQILAAMVAASGAIALSVAQDAPASISKDNEGLFAGTSPAPPPSATAITPEEASRLAKQASFGPTLALITEIVDAKSAEGWIEEQLNLELSSYYDLSTKAVPSDYCSKLIGNSSSECVRDNFSVTPLQMRFYANAMHKEDQVRQRVSFALSQIIVVSDYDVHSTAGLSTFNQILLSQSFGNYRNILKEVTLNGYMGDYLDMVDSNKIAPNENYARELMQLFSIGTALLNPNGTPQSDSTGAPIAAYTNNDVKEIARALTGWTYAHLGSATDFGSRDLSRPMEKLSSRFDSGAKAFLGTRIAAGSSQEENVDAVIDAVFNHPNTPPFVCKRLIQQLTQANPTPGYVERVSRAFVDNGKGMRGDMKAVVRAIYLDPEARAASPTPGKVKEPVLLATSLARAIGYKSDGYAFTTRDYSMGQVPFRSPSVFNFYSFDFPLQYASEYVSPSSKILNTSSIVARHNFVYDWTITGNGTAAEYQARPGFTGTQVDWASWEAHGADDAKTIDRINLVMLNGTMTAAQRASIASAMAAIKNNDPALQARKRAQVALYIVASSPLFQVDR